MQCNQPFYGNSFTNGPFGSPFNTHLERSASEWGSLCAFHTLASKSSSLLDTCSNAGNESRVTSMTRWHGEPITDSPRPRVSLRNTKETEYLTSAQLEAGAQALQTTQGMYPEIVGEGHVTSVTLPDGSVQFFFMPTIKWWSPSASQCHPFQTIPNPMFANTNFNIPPPYNNNVGTWFIRSISNPFPQNAFNSPNQRYEPPRLAINADYNRNLNNHDVGYQVKFHNDGGTSTTDLVYFYPGLRQRDFVFMPPCKDKTVQIDTAPVTNNTVCHYQVVCSKPCNCLVGARPMSLETLVVPNLTPETNQPCNYSTRAKPMRLEFPGDPNFTSKRIKLNNCVCSKPTSLEIPVDPNLTSKSIKTCDRCVCAKPVSFESSVDANFTAKSEKPYSNSADANEDMRESPADPNLTLKSKQQCSCTDTKPLSEECPADTNLTSKIKKPYNFSVDTNKPMSLDSLLDPNPSPKSNNTTTDDSSYNKEQNKRGKDTKKNKIICDCHPEEKKKKRHKARNLICECEPTANIVSVDKSITTYTDESVGSNPVDGRETQTSRTEDITSQCDVDAKPIQNKSPKKTKWIDNGCSSECTTCDERSGDDTNDKKYTQRNRGGKYKRSKRNKCECGCCDCDTSMDCCTASEVESVDSKDKGRETPFTCTSSNTTFVLENTRGSPIKIGKRASIGKANSSLQWLTSDNITQKCELNEKEMSEPPVSPAIVMDGKTSHEKLLDPSCTECDAAASTCGDGYV